MYRHAAIATSLLAVGCASTGPAPAVRSAGESETTLAGLREVQVVDVSTLPSDRDLDCRMVRPTGSRIAERRCDYRDERRARREHEVTREQLEQLREQQVQVEHARQSARAEALRELATR